MYQLLHLSADRSAFQLALVRSEFINAGKVGKLLQSSALHLVHLAQDLFIGFHAFSADKPPDCCAVPDQGQELQEVC